MAKMLARVDVRDVNLDDICIRAGDRIAQSDGSVGIGAGIQDDWRAGGARIMNPGDELAFVIGLAEDKLDAPLLADRSQAGLEIGERVAAINGGLARAEKVQVRAIEDEDGRHPESRRGRSGVGRCLIKGK